MNLRIKKALVKMAGNDFSQAQLEKAADFMHLLMGIGAGSEVVSSGEKCIFHMLQTRLAPPYCIFDVGANKGQFLNLTLSELGNADFNAHCFEPGKSAFDELQKVSPANPKLVLNNFGLGNEAGEKTLFYDTPGSGLASLTKRRLDHFNIDFSGEESVKITTLDEYCENAGVEHISLLKLDIEGHELEALSGGKGLFQEKKVDLVTFEFGGCNIDTRTFLQDFFYFLDEYGFAIKRISPSGKFIELQSYKESYEQFRTTNFLAVRRDAIE